MKTMKWISIAFGLLTAVSSFGQSPKNEDFARWLKAIEARVPIAEKQAETIVKMLASEKHRSRLEADLKTMFGDPTEKLPLSESYLGRVLTELGIPIEKSLVSLKILNQNYFGEASLLSPNFLIFIARGGDGRFGSPLHDHPGTFLGDKDRAERLSALCTRILALQRPVQLAARSKFDPADFNKMRVSNFAGGKVEMPEPFDARDLYGIFLPNWQINSEQTYWSLIEYKRPLFVSIYPAFLVYIKKQADYLDEIGYRMSFDSQTFSSVSAAVDKHMLHLAETTDLSDLTDPGSKTLPDSKMENSLDELKLPPD